MSFLIGTNDLHKRRHDNMKKRTFNTVIVADSFSGELVYFSYQGNPY